ncbi:MAG TPA: YerC/YecD family TrpR-related protein [Patescibacteria group bacterium]|nr:YerC/YecD family TrpR-related protein [Patescibacteria group bacterium]
MQYKPTKSEKELFQTISSIETEDECRFFLRDLLTEAEIKEFANRWKVARMLNQKIAYKQIERETGMSSTTIARIQKWLTNGMNGYQTMINKLQPMRKNTNNKSIAHHLLF